MASHFPIDISVIIPLYNEEESLPELAAWIERVMSQNGYSYEVIFVNDGSSDNSWQVIQDLRKKNLNFKGISFNRNYGKSAALNMGFKACKGEVVITMDADLQDSPDEIPELFALIKEKGFHIVSGWKQKRYDPIMKTLPSKLFNAVTSYMSGIKLHDFNCGLKAYQNKVVKTVDVYGEMHRYIPVIAKWAGFNKITEKPVVHQARKYGVTKFGLERFIYGFLDLMSIMVVSKFKKRPMHFFGALGTLMFFVGFSFSLYLGIDKLFIHTRGVKLSDRTEFYLALVSMLMGLQFFLTGFVAELISRSSSSRNSYLVEEKKGWG